jgi:hypothetical protein
MRERNLECTSELSAHLVEFGGGAGAYDGCLWGFGEAFYGVALQR